MGEIVSKIDRKIIPVKQKKDDGRTNFCFGFIGTNRTGKSSVAKFIAQQWKDANPDQIVVSHDPQDNFIEESDYFITPGDDEWALKCLRLRNALIILDDVRLINDKNTAVKGLQELLYYRAKYNLDIIHICHNPSLLLNILAYFTSHYYIFYTNAQEGSFKKKIPNYSLCEAASSRVNKYVSLFGRGKYPDFPYIIVDCENQNLKAINMNRNMSGIKAPKDGNARIENENKEKIKKIKAMMNDPNVDEKIKEICKTKLRLLENI